MADFWIQVEHVGEDGRLLDPGVVGAATHIICAGLPQLRELPCWPKITCVGIRDCGGLHELPRWPRVINIDCVRCDGLLTMPRWPRVLAVYFRGCNGLYRLPYWPRVTSVTITECPHLPTDLDGHDYVRWRDARLRTQSAVAVLLRRLGSKGALRNLPQELVRMLSELL